jgi:hypothetical protein
MPRVMVDASNSILLFPEAVVCDKFLKNHSACGHMYNKKNDGNVAPPDLSSEDEPENRWTRDFT